MTPQEMRSQLKTRQMRDHLKSMQQQEVSQESLVAPEYKNETPEWFNYKDRLAVKNLAKDTPQGIAYLQKQYPDAEFTSNDDEIFMRKKGEKNYGRLDPEGMGDWIKDTGDLAYDAVQMGAEAAGTVAGGAAGTALATPGAGTFAGASLGGGAASGAASALRQKLAEVAGVSEEADYGEAGKDALIAAAIPSIFKGAGKLAKYGAGKVAPSMYAKATGLTKDALKRIATKGDDLASMNETGALKKLQDIGGDVGDYVTSKKQQFADKYKAIRGTDADVDVSSVVKQLDQEIAKASQQAQANPGVNAFKEQIKELTEMKASLFSENMSPIKMNVNDAIDLDGKISEKFIDYGSDVGQGVGTGNTVSAQQERLAKLLRSELRGSVNKGTAGAKGAVDGDYSNFVEQINFLKKNFKDPKKIQGTIKGLSDKKDIELLGKFQQLDPELLGKINTTRQDLDLYRYFQPSNNSLLTENGLKDLAVGKAPIEKLLTALGTGAGYVSGGAVGGVAGGATGRVAGKVVASPRSVKAVSKAAYKTSKKTEQLMKALNENPELMGLIYGTANAQVD